MGDAVFGCSGLCMASGSTLYFYALFGQNHRPDKPRMNSYMDICLEVIFPAIDEINTTLPADRRLLKSRDTLLMGSGVRLDSIQLTAVILTVEEILCEKTGLDIALITETAMARSISPFGSVMLLAAYIEELLAQTSA